MQQAFFSNRSEAGKALAQKLQHHKNRDDVMIVALPRGGVPVAFEVSQALALPLEVVVVRKLGLPGREDFAMGAIASGGIEVLNEKIINILNIKANEIDKIRDQELQELLRREKLYRGNSNWPHYKKPCIILIDDGLATGYSMRVAIEAVRNLGAEKIIVAVPVASKETLRVISTMVDETVCLSASEYFSSISKSYEDFSLVSDEDVHGILQKSWDHKNVYSLSHY